MGKLLLIWEMNYLHHKDLFYPMYFVIYDNVLIGMLIVFFPDAINRWNTIITHFDKFLSYEILKSHLLTLFRPRRMPIFGIRDPIGLHYLFQLRIGLSPFRFHKNRHNFVDTPSATCVCNDGIEGVNHFLFHCKVCTNPVLWYMVIVYWL